MKHKPPQSVPLVCAKAHQQRDPVPAVVPTAAQKAARIQANAVVMRAIAARDAHLSVRVPADLKATLQQLADAEHRKLADYVHHALQQHVEAATRKRRGNTDKSS